jgi:hypothetical protein
MLVLVGVFAATAWGYFVALCAASAIFDTRFVYMRLFFLAQSKRRETSPGPCPICHDESPGYVTACGHAFHTTCITRWLLHATTCPICRTDLVRPTRRTLYKMCRDANDRMEVLINEFLDG